MPFLPLLFHDLILITFHLNRGVVSLVIFLEKNEAKKASCFSNHFAFKGVQHDRAQMCDFMAWLSPGA